MATSTEIEKIKLFLLRGLQLKEQIETGRDPANGQVLRRRQLNEMLAKANGGCMGFGKALQVLLPDVPEIASTKQYYEYFGQEEKEKETTE